MYLDFFSFTQKPFDITPDTHFLYLSNQHQQAIDLMLYGIRERRGFIILTGEVGTGKTTSIRALLNRLDGDVETSLVINPLVSTLELLQAINKDFGVDAAGNTIREQTDSLNAFLLDRAREGANAVVIIDEAQDLSMEALEMIRLLSNLETETHKLLQIVLAGQPELEVKLRQQSLRQLKQRIQIRFSLKPFSAEDTRKYIEYRLSRAHPKCCLVFESQAVGRVFEYTAGVPRLINTLCELILLAAFTEETHVITKKIVDMAFSDMEDKSGALPVPFWKRVMGRGGGRRVSTA